MEKKMITYYIDNNEGLIELYKHDRTAKNFITAGMGETIGMFTAMLTNSIHQMKQGESINITVEKIK